MSVTPYFVQQVDFSAINFTNPVLSSLTNNVFVKGLHSHNDYWREVPLLSALAHGVQSVEADIWTFPESFSANKTVTDSTGAGVKQESDEFKEGVLYVGHDLNYLNTSNTLDSLYLDHIYNLLEQANPKFDNSELKTSPHGVFFADASATLYLFLDTKLDANTTYGLVKPALQRFIDNDWLTFYNDTSEKWVKRPLTIVLTGNLPTELVKAEEKRYVTLDGHLDCFNGTLDNATLQNEAKYSVIASTSFGKILGDDSYKKEDFNEEDTSVIAQLVDQAHEFGLLTRIWGHVNWPFFIRNSHLDTLTSVGSDLINIDDLSIAYTY